MTQPTINEAQLQAIHEGDGHVLVLAGAGTGKTRVIVERIAFLAGDRGANPRRILALTFTNKAAAEMRERAAKRLNRDRLDAWLGTFHSFGLWVLRRDIERLGRRKTFTIFDDADQIALMKQLIKDLPPSLSKVSPREALGWISRFKQDLAEPTADSVEDPEDEAYAALWPRYHAALARHEAVDFDDLLVLPARLLEDAEVRARYHDRFEYILIDEYQDTNHAQYIIAKRLSEGHGNLFVVGDEDQSIYSWRGADIRNILEFERDFPDAKVYRLEQNYRSTAPILDAANAVVAHNANRLGKTLWTNQTDGDAVKIHEAANGDDEARYVVDSAAQFAAAGEGVAVLYRTNGQARLFEDALRRKGAPYVVVGGIKFYERKEVKDLLAYLRCAANANDDLAVRRVLNVPPRGLGSAALDRIEDRARQRNCSLMQAVRDAEHDESLTPRGRQGISEFIELIDALSADKGSQGVADLVETIIERTGYDEHVRKSDERDFRTGLEMIEEFASACAAFDAEERGGLEVFLQELALVSDIDAAPEVQAPVTLMTCHSAKGLEFDHVYLVGMEEGLLPHANALDDGNAIEEERRLCYVAMTRARRRLTLTSARERLLYGRRQDCHRSRFLDEIPFEAPAARGAPERAKSAPALAATGFDPGDVKMGTRVRHAKFGEGVIMFTSGSGAKLKARIKFDTGRSRDFLVSAAPLEVIQRNHR